MDNRAVSPVVGKLLAAGLAVLYVASATGFLLGGVVPNYRTVAGDELGERVLASTAGEIEQAIPDVDGRVSVRTELEIPRTIAGERYSLTVRNRTLHLEHPEDGIGAPTELSLPAEVTVKNGTVDSTATLVIRVSGPASNRTLTLREGDQ